MIKLFVDSCSSIKQDEKEKYGVEIFPLKVFLGGREYLDGIDLTMDEFYHKLIDEKLFPKTSLPSLTEAEEKVSACTEAGDDVIIITIASGLSGTYQSFKMHFANNPKVRVIDSKSAAGGIRILVEEANKHREEPLDVVAGILEELVKRVKIIAIPDTLTYLHRGGRLSRAAWAFGSILQLKPLISLTPENGSVDVIGKARGKRRAMEWLAKALDTYNCDTSYSIVPVYTYDPTNLDQLIAMTDDKYKGAMTEYDNVDLAVSSHWGPGAFGYMFVMKK